MTKKTSYDFEDYIASEPAAVRKRMRDIRVAIRKAAPEATEKFVWTMPTFYQDGNLIHFCSFKEHISVFPGPEVIDELGAAVSARRTSKGTLQFPNDEPLPLALITRIARVCVAQMKARVKAKAAKKKAKSKKKPSRA